MTIHTVAYGKCNKRYRKILRKCVERAKILQPQICKQRKTRKKLF